MTNTDIKIRECKSSNRSGNSEESGEERIRVTDFTESSARRFHEQVMKAADHLPETIPIIIYISSYGGYVDSLASMIETLEAVPHKIITVCQGYAMSCGAILFSCGDYRFVGRHSRVMIHEVSGAAMGDTHDVVNDAAETHRLNEYWLGILAKNCGLKDYSSLRKIVKDRDGRDIWLDAQASIDFGIADFIGLPKLEPYTVANILVKAERDYPKRKTKRKTKKRTTRKKVTKKTATRKTRKKTTDSKNNTSNGQVGGANE